MRFIRFARDLKDIKGTYRDLAAEAARADNDASDKLVLMARGFARRSRRVVDDKLSFSATLMRAGEVDGANRLLDEVQTEVRTEEAALMEKVNEAKAAQAVRREKMTRLRFVRLVAVAVMGSMVMGLSAVGFAAVSFFDARERDAARQSRSSLKVATVEHELKAHKLARRLAGTKDGRVAGILMKLSMADLLELQKLTSRGVDALELQRFLVAALPSAELAHELTDKIVGVAAGTRVAAAPLVKKAGKTADGALLGVVKKRAKEEAESKSSETEQSKDSEPADEPSSENDPRDEKDPPEEEPQPKLPPNNPFDGQSSDKDEDGDLLE